MLRVMPAFAVPESWRFVGRGARGISVGLGVAEGLVEAVDGEIVEEGEDEIVATELGGGSCGVRSEEVGTGEVRTCPTCWEKFHPDYLVKLLCWVSRFHFRPRRCSPSLFRWLGRRSVLCRLRPFCLFLHIPCSGSLQPQRELFRLCNGS